MEEHEKKALDKKLTVSLILLLVNLFLFLLSICTKTKILDYIYYGSLIVYLVGMVLLIIVKLTSYNKERTYRLTILYLASFFMQLVNVLTMLDSCLEEFRR